MVKQRCLGKLVRSPRASYSFECDRSWPFPEELLDYASNLEVEQVQFCDPY